MGASHWWYSIKFDADMRTTFTRLRERVFASHDYVWEGDEDDPRPETIDDLLEAQEDEGTHSILDIDRVDDEPDVAVLSPLSDGELREIFGSTTPSLDEATAWARSGELARGIGEGAYVIVHGGSEEFHHVVISGASGD